MRFLVDAQLPPALARWLVSQNHEAEHVADIGMADASDTAIWEIATVTKAVIITKDEDFAQRRNLHNSQYPAIVWLRIGNTRRAELLQWFSALMPPRFSCTLNPAPCPLHPEPAFNLPPEPEPCFTDF